MNNTTADDSRNVEKTGEALFDYIIVGAGAGGGPLAAGLAKKGKRVLLIDAGGDPRKAGEIYKTPGFHGAATENPDLSWAFSVRHYENDAKQKKDDKYDSAKDASVKQSSGASSEAPGGIFYPRSSNIGGCTAHHAMIMVAPNDCDWDYIASLTGDDSWRASNMHKYFSRLENCKYRKSYLRFLSRTLGAFWIIFNKLRYLIDPRLILDDGGHGVKVKARDKGSAAESVAFEEGSVAASQSRAELLDAELNHWQPTSLIDPELIRQITTNDQKFGAKILDSALSVVKENPLQSTAWKNSLLRGTFIEQLDFNDRNTRRANSEGVFLIPMGIQSSRIKERPKKGALRGERKGLFEHITKTKEKTATLTVWEDFYVTKILFSKGISDACPAAIGVEGYRAAHVYGASAAPEKPDKPKEKVLCSREVIISGGAFNTPQLLMLSGIGDCKTLKDKDISQPTGSDNSIVSAYIDLPGVGKNLQDRLEVSVVSEVKPFSTLKNVSFDPNSTTDESLQEYKKYQTGLYATNGGTIAIVKRSSIAVKNGVLEPDIFAFGAPASFYGYFWHWSKELTTLPTKLRIPSELPEITTTDRSDSDKNGQKNSGRWAHFYEIVRNGSRLLAKLPATLKNILTPGHNSASDPAKSNKDTSVGLWSWVILKAYTKNDQGTVQLVSNDPLVPPQICFNYDKSTNSDGLKEDVLALVDAIESIRKINRSWRFQSKELLPRYQNKSDLEAWVQNQAWGHHACGTCRMGSDPWTENPLSLKDRNAVLDSRFRVHGVRNLRVVDASIFPKIPGYFIVAPIFMVSEKAVDEICHDECETFPLDLARRELEMISKRREEACLQPSVDFPETIGLALSGGGIRSATFCLGVIQALAKKDVLRNIDYLSTVSGGGYIGGFLGRLYESIDNDVKDKAERVQSILADGNSPQISWLRQNANYIGGQGVSDLRQNLAILFRNLLSIHLLLGTFFIAIFSLLHEISDAVGRNLSILYFPALVLERDIRGNHLIPALDLSQVCISKWLWLFCAFPIVMVVPVGAAYWLSFSKFSKSESTVAAIWGWTVLLFIAVGALILPGAFPYAVLAILMLTITFLWQEAERIGLPTSRPLMHAVGSSRLLGQKSETSNTGRGAALRNRMTNFLGEAMHTWLIIFVFFVIDSIAATAATTGGYGLLLQILIVAAPVLPVGRTLAQQLKAISDQPKSGRPFSAFAEWTAGVIAAVLGFYLLLTSDTLVHVAFSNGAWWANWLLISSISFSLVVGRAFGFLNMSSFHLAYAARLTRTFLGATNPERIYTENGEGLDIGVAQMGDDVAMDEYHPEKNGGPLHIVNVCVNETIDLASQRDIRERKGLSMAVGPAGISVGKRFHALWTKPMEDHSDLNNGFWAWLARLRGAGDGTPIRYIPLNGDPLKFHVLGNRFNITTKVESISLGQWIAISGAAVSTGLGRVTSLPLSLLFGMLNIRLGYWWDSKIGAGDRPDRYPPGLVERFKAIPSILFHMQTVMLNEWRAHFSGPSKQFWYLTDGGHFENTATYELIRRRVKFIIAIDGGEDPAYKFSDLALLTRLIRLDFGANIDWLNPIDPNEKEWKRFANPANIPTQIQGFLNAGALGRRDSIKQSQCPQSAALGRITYDSDSKAESWILLIKASLCGDEPVDLAEYALSDKAFPNDSTGNQFFDGAQWEAYRLLGEHLGRKIFA